MLPDVPTAKEVGVDYEMSIWAGIFAPKSTPEPIVNKLAVALDKSLDDTGVAAKQDKHHHQAFADEQQQIGHAAGLREVAPQSPCEGKKQAAGDRSRAQVGEILRKPAVLRFHEAWLVPGWDSSSMK